MLADLEPWTEYDIYVAACTGGGCTASDVIKQRTQPDSEFMASAAFAVTRAEFSAVRRAKYEAMAVSEH